MKKPFAVLNRNTGQLIEFFEYPVQADKYIYSRFNGSNVFKVLDLRRKNARKL